MFAIKLLQRKDAAAVIVAVVLGLALAQYVSTLALNVSSLISELVNQAPQPGARQFEWRSSLFEPTIILLLQVAMLELFLQVTVRGRRIVGRLTQQAKRQ